jgi:PIN domain nuclease of toxin-antitoxin system
MLLLDTHSWIWTVEGDTKKIGQRARRLIQQAAARDRIRISPVTIFEVTALSVAGRLRLAQSLERWMDEALAVPGLRVAELTVDIAIDAGSIPRVALGDPLDRLLVATARALTATFLTADASILGYAAATGRLRVADASK